MIVDSKRAEKAVQYQIDTDAEYGRLKALKTGIEYRLKVIKSTEFLKASGTMAEKEAKSLTSQPYMDKLAEYEQVCLDLEIIAARRKTGEIIIEVYRTESANYRKGNI